jgi:hypothetical protein
MMIAEDYYNDWSSAFAIILMEVSQITRLSKVFLYTVLQSFWYIIIYNLTY